METTLPVFEKKTKKLKLDEIKDKYQCFRFTNPKIENKLKMSLSQHGQLTPVIVSEEAGQYELIDGFKRWRVSKDLPQFHELEVKVLTSSAGLGKAAMMNLNQERKGLNPMEEALVICAMHRQDQLPQNRIAELINKHSSWVCRRVTLAEKCHEKVIESMRLGLLHPSMGRHLAKLPRGNQEHVVLAIQEYQLSCRETEMLVNEMIEKDAMTEKEISELAKKLQASRDEKKLKRAEDKKTSKGIKKPSLKELLLRMRDANQAVIDFAEDNDIDIIRSMSGIEMRMSDARNTATRAIELMRKRKQNND